MHGISQFGFSERANLAIGAAVFARSKRLGMVSEWSADEFADQLTSWLVEEGLMPVHVAPDDFRRLVARRVADVQIAGIESTCHRKTQMSNCD